MSDTLGGGAMRAQGGRSIAMDLKFYYAPMTSASRVHWALEELGIPYEKFKLDLAAGDQKKPEYLALNPNGKVPLLVAEGRPIFEGLAILLYLGERFGADKGLFPPPNPDRAEAFKWMAWGAVTFGEALQRYLRNSLDRFPEDERSPKAAEAAKKDLASHLAILNEALEGKEYLVGNTFSFVDISIAPAIPFLGRFGIDVSPFPNVNAWVARCIARPAFARVMQG
ncbi:glutathione S-transferase family protein [Polyangium jinanense]|uniref:Glutathione S-transferase family protein n=1 Tax=Polyangium jinanense TaxID=2829994 RepID=A0A9X4AS06_9BACT|nr:glutathione S-transferase family protein [Polyangium jinanense]MDC3957256.1 glutathione S-transferase family protein [Polyangium jinanense]MDC3982658.1 glutathione S-transferase family protein [Polyangium jinanense]